MHGAHGLHARGAFVVRRPQASFVKMGLPFTSRENDMPKGDKSAYTDKQKRQAQHIEEGYEKKGVSEEEAKRRAWATENKISGGGKKSGSGRAHSH